MRSQIESGKKQSHWAHADAINQIFNFLHSPSSFCRKKIHAKSLAKRRGNQNEIVMFYVQTKFMLKCISLVSISLLFVHLSFAESISIFCLENGVFAFWIKLSFDWLWNVKFLQLTFRTIPDSVPCFISLGVSAFALHQLPIMLSLGWALQRLRVEIYEPVKETYFAW